MKFINVALSEVYSDFLEMFELHYREIARHQDIPLAPNFPKYAEIEAAGGLAMYAIESDDGFQGYAIFFISTHIHYSTSLQAMQDVLYIQKQHRKTGLGAKFISYCDDELRKLGVQVVYHHSKVAKDFGKTLLPLGYEHVENVYGKRLDK